MHQDGSYNLRALVSTPPRKLGSGYISASAAATPLAARIPRYRFTPLCCGWRNVGIYELNFGILDATRI